MPLSPILKTVDLRATPIDCLFAHALHFVLSVLTLPSRSSLLGRCAVRASLAQAEAQLIFYAIQQQPPCYEKGHRCTRSLPFSGTVQLRPRRFTPK